MTTRAAQSRNRQRGNAFVEAAFVLVPLFALIFAIVDFGLAIFVRSTLQHATREGVRYAVTYRTLEGLGHDGSIKQVVQNASMGFLAGEAGSDKVAYRDFDPSLFLEVGDNSPGNLVEVSVENYTFGWIAPLMRSAAPITMLARSSDRMEGLPTGSLPPAR
ncbi:MAG: pilus assembly protein [bacterium]|nr:pilus assembly protein [bacterium]